MGAPRIGILEIRSNHPCRRLIKPGIDPKVCQLDERTAVPLIKDKTREIIFCALRLDDGTCTKKNTDSGICPYQQVNTATGEYAEIINSVGGRWVSGNKVKP